LALSCGVFRGAQVAQASSQAVFLSVVSAFFWSLLFPGACWILEPAGIGPFAISISIIELFV
jgi:hypothetical protein